MASQSSIRQLNRDSVSTLNDHIPLHSQKRRVRR